MQWLDTHFCSCVQFYSEFITIAIDQDISEPCWGLLDTLNLKWTYRENSSDDWYESLSLFEWSGSCISWTFCLDLMSVRESWLLFCGVLCGLVLCFCLGRDFLLRHTLAKWCSFCKLNILVHMQGIPSAYESVRLSAVCRHWAMASTFGLLEDFMSLIYRGIWKYDTLLRIYY